MKNVILTHKELQTMIYVAFLDGMCSTFRMPQGYFLTGSNEKDYFTFELWQSATAPEVGDGKKLFSSKGINKGACELNDIRLGVGVAYIRKHAQFFIEQVEDWFKEKHRNEFPLTGNQSGPQETKMETIKVVISKDDANELKSKGHFVDEIV